MWATSPCDRMPAMSALPATNATKKGGVWRSGRPGRPNPVFVGLRRWIVFALASVCLAGLLAGCTSSKTAAKDVTITSCKGSPTGGHPTAQGMIRNHSSKSSAYTIHVKFKDSSGNGVGDGVALVAKVDPGTTAKWHATGTLNAKGSVNCVLSTVNRAAVP